MKSGFPVLLSSILLLFISSPIGSAGAHPLPYDPENSNVRSGVTSTGSNHAKRSDGWPVGPVPNNHFWNMYKFYECPTAVDDLICSGPKGLGWRGNISNRTGWPHQLFTCETTEKAYCHKNVPNQKFDLLKDSYEAHPVNKSSIRFNP
ncbi:hypothetical protein PTTG_29088 [Puccinia triticina 1-1 BBBD Race 1]|uniref:Secreted protein n=2 Tax=Puccinia triticina TaxID=208348 RepID=A0A180G6F3_PUCT1|nr:uncharacterized protein PtA15_15A34 [Puccinia triticina]OAV88265.1 hypothetical protein PTTG_29088 [Puccinia triticina 1-1 BBBD Race 1]WAQ91645.1 hypothetical protein PtA15_15A34 [Puccinia triticina]WAR62444.1 hypothetical protein PtB15_15B28 [Puccinia triticina]